MSETVDKILSGLDKKDDEGFWTLERLEGLQTIAVLSTFWQDVSTSLDSIPVTLRVLYNEEDEGFFVDILSADGEIDVKGLRACTNSDMLDGLAFPELGKLFIFDNEKENIDPDYEGFGNRFILGYLPKAYAR